MVVDFSGFWQRANSIHRVPLGLLRPAVGQTAKAIGSIRQFKQNQTSRAASISSLAAALMRHPSSLKPFFAPVPTSSSPGQRDACQISGAHQGSMLKLIKVPSLENLKVWPMSVDLLTSQQHIDLA